jgi:hypothetical protein
VVAGINEFARWVHAEYIEDIPIVFKIGKEFHQARSDSSEYVNKDCDVSFHSPTKYI